MNTESKFPDIEDEGSDVQDFPVLNQIVTLIDQVHERISKIEVVIMGQEARIATMEKMVSYLASKDPKIGEWVSNMVKEVEVVKEPEKTK